MTNVSSVNKINDIDRLYDKAIPVEVSGGFQCPVCKKTLKTLKGIEAHMGKRDCYDVRALFEHTEHEKKALEFFKAVMAEWAPRARSHISSFRKNKSYSLFLKYVIFCALHEVQDKELFFAWLRDVKNRKTIHGILSAGLDEGNLREYRTWLMENPEWIDSSTFIDRYVEDLKSDPHFLIRSLEKAHVALSAVKPIDGLDLDSIPLDYKIRLSEISKKSAEI